MCKSLTLLSQLRMHLHCLFAGMSVRFQPHNVPVGSIKAQTTALRDYVLELLCGPCLKLKAYILWINVVKAILSELWMERNHRRFWGKLVYVSISLLLLV